MRTAGYVRVSTEDQAKLASPAEQREKILKYCDLRGWEAPVWYEDSASGKRVDGRDEYQRLLADVAAGRFDMVVAWDTSRFGRNMYEALGAFGRDFKPHGVDLALVKYMCDTSTDTGEMVFAFTAMMAHMEGKHIIERTTMGKRASVASGGVLANGKRTAGWWGGRAPYGYKPSGTREGGLVPNAYEAAVVQRIFAEIEDRGPAAIARGLNQDGLKTRFAKDGSKPGAAWTEQQVRRVLSREGFYRGTHGQDGTPVQRAAWDPLLGTGVKWGVIPAGTPGVYQDGSAAPVTSEDVGYLEMEARNG